MKQYVIFIIAILTTGGIVYGLSKETEDEFIERINRDEQKKFAKEQTECLTKATATGTSSEISQKLNECQLRQIPKLKTISGDSDLGIGQSGKVLVGENKKEIVRDDKKLEECLSKYKKIDNNVSNVCMDYAEGTGKLAPTTSEPPSQGYTAKHKINLTDSHDYRKYSNRKGAGWKNNNPSGLTWGVSNTLKNLWKEAGIKYTKGTYRPKNEGGNYVMFESVEDGLRAKIIAIRERWGKATVSHFLGGWGTDYVKLSFSKDKQIKDITDQEFAELFIQQIKKETPGYISQLVEDGIIIID